MHHRSSPLKSDENHDDCSNASTAGLNSLASQSQANSAVQNGSVSTGNNCIHRCRQSPEYGDHTNRDSRCSIRGISTHDSFTNSRYRRGNSYSCESFNSNFLILSMRNGRRSRHQHNNDIDMYRMHQHGQYDAMHSHAVGGLLRQNSWSGSNISLGSNRSRSSMNSEHKVSGCKNRQYEESDSVQMRTSNSHSLGPILMYTATIAGVTSLMWLLVLLLCHLSVASDLNMSVDPYDLFHFNQGIPLLNNASDDLAPSSAQEPYSQKVSDLQTFTARPQAAPRSSVAYLCHRWENERALLALLNLIASSQQQCILKRQAVANRINRYFSEMNTNENDSGVSTEQQQHRLTTTQPIGVLQAVFHPQGGVDTLTTVDPPR
ncbi:hypothetical protein KIN20_026975 [Parelaphostrongylus tenuis]|uniref:Uncharacterized protein n=1 Tax=Parelaphostrongylus tenuis TaxID=148309 RepID=A0AAD5WDE6_PARTN|nr:hypothetical protein KIN20_026975 [Parelaphostrongylus tenuis]